MPSVISEVQITPLKPRDGLVGIASVVLNNDLYLGSLGIMTRPQGGYRVTYPLRKHANGSFNIYHPINRAFAQELSESIINRFEQIAGEAFLSEYYATAEDAIDNQ